MLKVLAAALATLFAIPAMACDEACLRLLKEQVKALEAQARSFQRLERLELDHNRQERFDPNRKS